MTNRAMRQWRAARPFARLALGAAFLSGIAATIPFLAWAATVAELVLGLLLVAGAWPRAVALSSAALLALFGSAMAVSLGIKSPLDYSVFSACAAALLLTLAPAPFTRNEPEES